MRQPYNASALLSNSYFRIFVPIYDTLTIDMQQNWRLYNLLNNVVGWVTFVIAAVVLSWRWGTHLGLRSTCLCTMSLHT